MESERCIILPAALRVVRWRRHALPKRRRGQSGDNAQVRDFDGTFRNLSRTNRPPSHNPVIVLPALMEGLLRFEPHGRDWREGDPSWQDGKGKGLIGHLNHLCSQGVNSVHFLAMNLNGDGRNVWPWIDPWIRDRFDISKLDHWEIVFSRMTRLGIVLHLVRQETENDHLLGRGDHPGLHEHTWFNPRTGGEFQADTVQKVRGPGLLWTGFPPTETSKDWLALARCMPEIALLATQFPGADWRELPPLDVGIDHAGLHHALNYWRMFSGTNGADEVVMARRGVVFHRGPAVTKVHGVWSVTKSFTSMALGVLEKFILMEMSKPCAWSETQPQVYCWRTVSG